MNERDKQNQDEQKPPIEDLAINEEDDEEVKGGALVVPNLLVSRRSANG